MLVKSFASGIIIDISYKLDKYIHCKHVSKIFEVDFYINTVIILYRLDGNEKLLEIFACFSNNRVFYGPELNTW